jgi:phage baseplate assembly protein W
MSTRADRYTQIQKIPDLYSDFFDDLTPHPVTKDLMRVRNDQSVKQSVKNLVLTNIGERLFQPTIGSTVNGSLFEPNDAFLADDLKSSIRNVIESNEPRVTLIDVLVSPQADEVSVNVTIIFALINNMQPQSLDIILRRVR